MRRRSHLVVFPSIVAFCLFITDVGRAATGSIVAQYNFVAKDFVADPAQPYMYVSVVSGNLLQVINTDTLAVAQTIPLSGTPGGMSLSADGASLFIAQMDNTISVLDTHSLTISRTITTASANRDIAVGLGNRLYVLHEGFVYSAMSQIDAVSGVASSFNQNWAIPGGGNLAITADRSKLYYGEHALSPSTLDYWDVTSATASPILQLVTGSNGHEAVISPDDRWVSHPNGAPYEIDLLNTLDLSVAKVFDIGPYPAAIAFTPDSQRVFLDKSNNPGLVQIYDTNTFGLTAQFTVSNDQPSRMMTDNTGQYLFASLDGAGNFVTNPRIVVYDTGYTVPVPEPASVSVLFLAAVTLLCRRRS